MPLRAVMLLLYRTHLLGGFAAGYLATGSVACGTASAVFSLLPDIESPKSFIGRRLLPVSVAGKLVFGHRQAFHSLIGAFLFAAAAHLFFGPHFSGAGVSCFAGYVSHLALDSFNPAGVPWLWPYRKRFSFPLVETGSIAERMVVLPGLAGIVSLLFIRGFFISVANLLKGAVIR
ncbi:MAG TPA: metal-dependent hydrolase [Peptococcaceae bacterium]|nr:metal-dependent hydrolase [Peptococcaceae bacterium]